MIGRILQPKTSFFCFYFIESSFASSQQDLLFYSSDAFNFLGLLDWAGDDGASDNLPGAFKVRITDKLYYIQQNNAAKKKINH